MMDKELAKKQRKEAYEKQKALRKKARDEEKLQKTEEKKRARQAKDAALWEHIKKGDEKV